MLALVAASLCVAAGAFAAPAAQAHGQTVIHNVLVQAHDNGKRFGFTIPSRIPTGLVQFIFENRGTQDHELQLFHLKPGKTERQLFAALSNQNSAQSIRQILALIDRAGGAASIPPGGRQDVIDWVTPGHWVAVCFDTTPSGVPHFLLGMFKGFWAVSGTKAFVDEDDPTRGGVPTAASTVVLSNFHISLPSAINRSRAMTLRVTDVGSQPHMVEFMRVPTGTTVRQVAPCFNPAQQAQCPFGETPVAGGHDALGPGQTGWMEIHLRPGTYVAACFVPDVKTGMPHAFMGMWTLFNVR
jgi:hypothetical protein